MENTSYTTLTKLLHWALAVLVAIQFAVSWIMPEVRGTADPSSLMNLHMSFGLVVLPLALLLLVLRYIRPVTKIVTPGIAWREKAATIMHYALYILLIVLPFSGWAFASVRGWTVRPFGLFELPVLFAGGSAIGHTFGEMHSVFATLIGLLILGHAGAALYHHFVLKDAVLARMLPGSVSSTEVV